MNIILFLGRHLLTPFILLIQAEFVVISSLNPVPISLYLMPHSDTFLHYEGPHQSVYRIDEA